MTKCFNNIHKKSKWILPAFIQKYVRKFLINMNKWGETFSWHHHNPSHQTTISRHGKLGDYLVDTQSSISRVVWVFLVPVSLVDYSISPCMRFTYNYHDLNPSSLASILLTHSCSDLDPACYKSWSAIKTATSKYQ